MSGLYEAPFVERLQRGVESLLGEWGLASGSVVELLTVSENATFRIRDRTSARTLVTRVHRPGYHTHAEIVSELAWIQALRGNQVVVTPAPVPRMTGDFIAQFDDQGEPRDVVAFEFMSGSEPAAGDALVSGFIELGAISAHLHAHVRQWERPAGFQRKAWTFDTIAGANAHWGPWQEALGLDADGHAVLSAAVNELQAAYRCLRHG